MWMAIRLKEELVSGPDEERRKQQSAELSWSADLTAISHQWDFLMLWQLCNIKFATAGLSLYLY